MGHGKYIHATGRAPPYTTGATNKYELGYKQSSVQARCALRAAWGRWEWSPDPDEGCQGGPRGYTTGLREILGFWCVRPWGSRGERRIRLERDDDLDKLDARQTEKDESKQEDRTV